MGEFAIDGVPNWVYNGDEPEERREQMNGRNQPRTRTGNSLADRRVKLGLTQEEAARRIGVHRVLLAKWEGGKNKPSADNLVKLAKTYGTTIDELLN